MESPTLQHFEESLRTLKILPGGRLNAFCNSAFSSINYGIITLVKYTQYSTNVTRLGECSGIMTTSLTTSDLLEQPGKKDMLSNLGQPTSQYEYNI